MSRYYGDYYDPVGSQSNQPSGYKHQSPNTSASAYPSTSASAGYSYHNYESNDYAGQRRTSNIGQQSSDQSHDYAAAALSNLSSQSYAQPSTGAHPNSTRPYDQSWYASGSESRSRSGAGASSYSANAARAPNPAQHNVSPLYANPTSSNNMTAPTQRAPSSDTYSATAYQPASSSTSSGNRYQPSLPAVAQSQPQRYNSPLGMMQRQQKQQQQSSDAKQYSQSSAHRSSQQPSPQTARITRPVQQSQTNNSHYASNGHFSRQSSDSVEPGLTTVDPSQVYDNRAELQRKAQAEAEKRRRHEADQAAKKAQEERVEAEKRRDEEKKRKEVEKAEAASKKAERDHVTEQRRKARDEKKQSQKAATALQRMSSDVGKSSAAATLASATTDEAEMRAMFQRMREFNSKNPAMLAKMWEEERQTHVQSQSPQTEQPRAASIPATSGSQVQPQSTGPAEKTQDRPSESTPQPQGIRPSKRPDPPRLSVEKPPKPRGRPPANKPSGNSEGSLWPSTKKADVAEQTSKWIMSMPQNNGKTLTKNDVLKILDTNPNYVQLCEALEKLALRFERSSMARELLKVTPNPERRTLSSPVLAATKPKQTKEEIVAEVVAIQRRQKMVKEFLRETENDPPELARERWQSFEAANLPNCPRENVVQYQTPNAYSGTLSAAAHAANTLDLHADTRKCLEARGISPSAIHGSSNDNTSRVAPRPHQPEITSTPKPGDLPRPPADKEEAARKRTFNDLVDLTAEDSDDEPPPTKIHRGLDGPTTGIQLSPTDLPQHHNHHHAYVQPGSGHATPGSSGRTFAPSNATMVSQSGAKPVVQPVRVQQPPPRPKGPLPEQIQQSRMKGKMLVEPIMRDRVARKDKYDSRTIARDVLLATGRHPDMRGLNAHLAPMSRLLSHYGGDMDSDGRGNRSDLATIRWDIIDPEQPEKVTKPGITQSIETAVREVNNGDTASPLPIPSSQRQYQSTSKPGPKPGQPQVEGGPLTKAAEHAKHNAGTAPASRQSRTTTAYAPARNDTDMSGKAVGYNAFNQTLPDGTRKKGRPFGWKKSVHSREAQGLAPSSGSKATPKSASNRAKQSQEAQNDDAPRYQVYKCLWADCKAELHNLETLRKHITKLHSGLNDDLEHTCEWEHCAANGGDVLSFSNAKAWIGHVEEAHLQPIAWRQGDGPKGGTPIGIDPDAPYLADSHGRSVTPIISPPPIVDDQESETPNEPAVLRKTFMRPTDPASPFPKEGYFLSDLEEHVRVVGATLGRQGCILASKERRKTLLDDEDFEDEVYGSEHDATGQL